MGLLGTSRGVLGASYENRVAQRQRKSQLSNPENHKPSNLLVEKPTPIPSRDPPNNALQARLFREHPFKQVPVPIRLLCRRRVMREPFRGIGKLFVGNNSLGVGLEAVDPAVADTVRELFLLAPEDFVGEVRVFGVVECLADHVFLHLVEVRRLVDELVVGGYFVHGNVEESLVEEGNTAFETPGHRGLVGAETVRGVEVLDALDALVVELLGVGRRVEVEVAYDAERISEAAKRSSGAKQENRKKTSAHQSPNPHPPNSKISIKQPSTKSMIMSVKQNYESSVPQIGTGL